MLIRAYQDTDFDALVSLWWDSWHSSASFSHPKPVQEWQARWRTILTTHSVMVAERGNQLLGFAALKQHECIVSQLFVAPSAKRQGVGRALLAWATSCCPNGLTLKTLVENTEARAFYQSLGMIERGNSINDFSGRKEIEYGI